MIHGLDCNKCEMSVFSERLGHVLPSFEAIFDIVCDLWILKE